MGQMLKDQFANLPKEYQKDVPPLTEVYRMDPTPECPSGTRGRIAAFEMFDMTVELERAILERRPEDELMAIVRKNGMLTMKEDAIIKSAQGIVPFEEVNTLGGEFELPEVEALVPVAAPVALAEDGSVASKSQSQKIKEEPKEVTL